MSQNEVAAEVEIVKVPLHITSTLLVIGFALLSAVLSEVYSYYMIYRKDDYKRIVGNIENITKQLEKSKQSSIFSDPSKVKRAQKL